MASIHEEALKRPHTETYVHHYKLHGYIDSEITKCKACHRAIYPAVPRDFY